MPIRSLAILSLFACTPDEPDVVTRFDPEEAMQTPASDLYETLCPLPPESVLPLDLTTGEIHEDFKQFLAGYQGRNAAYATTLANSPDGERQLGLRQSELTTESKESVSTRFTFTLPEIQEVNFTEEIGYRGFLNLSCYIIRDWVPGTNGERHLAEISINYSTDIYDLEIDGIAGFDSLLGSFTLRDDGTYSAYFAANGTPYEVEGSLENGNPIGATNENTTDAAFFDWLSNQANEATKNAYQICDNEEIIEFEDFDGTPGQTLVKECTLNY
jgi:hypothetical protein